MTSVLQEVNCYRVTAVAANGHEFMLEVTYDTREQARDHVRDEIKTDERDRPAWYSLADGGVLRSSVVIALMVIPWFDPARDGKPKRKRSSSRAKATT